MAADNISIQDKIKDEFIKCATDPVYFMKKYFTIQHPTRGRMLFDLYPFQEKVLKIFQLPEDDIINKSRQLGISTLVAAYSLWLMLFHKDKNILVIATKQDTAKNMVTKVRFAFSNLPKWMRTIAKSTSDNALSLSLSNGSVIKAVSAAADSGRSEAVSLLVLDEAAFVADISTIYTAAKMTLATGGKCIALSTPNGVGNWFHKTYTAAQKKENNFTPISLPWTVHPERDIEWRKQQDVDLGVRMAAQECDTEFATSGNSVVLPDILNFYQKEYIKEPIAREGLDKALWIWEFPDLMKYYMIVADVARGDGADYSTYHVIDVDSMTQVAEYKSQCDTRFFANELIAIATRYNRGLLVIENANIGWDVIQSVLESGYSNMHYSHRADNSADFQNYLSVHNGGATLVPGFTMSSRVRPSVVEKMRDSLENKFVIIRSIRLLDELRVFIWKNSRGEAMQGYNDDLVMAFAIGMYLRETSIRYKRASENLTIAALNSIGKSSADPQSYSMQDIYAQNPWKMQINTPGGSYNEDLSWML